MTRAKTAPRDVPLSSAPDGQRRALFLDRDGVINEEIGYLHRPADVHFVPGIFSLLRAAQRLGYLLMVVTNQSGIARGLYSTADFEALMLWMRERLAEEQIQLTGVYHCPFHPEEGVGELRREHPDRKPGPGMLLRAAHEHALDLGRSVMIGDRCSDVAAANAAGLPIAMLLDCGPDSPAAEGCPGAYHRVTSLLEAERLLEEIG